MACCCQSCKNKSSSSCLGRCDLPKHRCLEKEDVKPGPVPKHMGWMYCAKSSPRFQQKCGWRPGHISCTVLRRIEAHNGSRETCRICPSRCSTRPCASRCSSRPCSRPCSRTCLFKSCSRACSRPCLKPCFPPPSSCSGPACPPGTPLIRIIRRGGKYKICTKPSNLDNSPSGPYPLKYVLNADTDTNSSTKFSIEAKFNDYQYDYTSSQTSFVLDFCPPPSTCARPCPKKSILCMFGQCDNSWPPGTMDDNEAKGPKLQKDSGKSGDNANTGITKGYAATDNTGATKRNTSTDSCVEDYNSAKGK
ncbi:uncharacterized protein LOC125235294 [Leguminivora glycinivorella]|uniref:uncharacterized protein LOC125235294 n=1 Tax=Leguminivora glycinivorella TaxID=1035111 RepID=UPI00200EBEED|nr:uncharacterized protein LOC125235294 [Leguminivora glycinivorella]